MYNQELTIEEVLEGCSEQLERLKQEQREKLRLWKKNNREKVKAAKKRYYQRKKQMELENMKLNNVTQWKKFLDKENMVNINKPDELLAALLVAGGLTIGSHKATLMRWIGKPAMERPEKFIEYYNNLVDNEIFLENGKMVLTSDWEKYSNTEFGLMVCCAQGFIVKSNTKASEKEKNKSTKEIKV